MPAEVEVRPVADADALARQAAEFFVEHATQAVSRHGRCTVALSGGSTPRKLFTLLASDYRTAVPWDKIVLFWGDERFVPADHADSNYRMTRETLLDHVAIPSANVHRIPTDAPSAAEAAEQYEATLRSFFAVGDGEWPRFDLVFLGLGPDAHTASLFPGTEAVHEATRWVTAPWVEKFHTYRVTLSPPVINHAAVIAFLVAGADKAAALHQVRFGTYQPDVYPAQIIMPLNGRLLWFLDRAALGE